MKLLVEKFIKHRAIEQNMNFADQLKAKMDNAKGIKYVLAIIDPLDQF